MHICFHVIVKGERGRWGGEKGGVDERGRGWGGRVKDGEGGLEGG